MTHQESRLIKNNKTNHSLKHNADDQSNHNTNTVNTLTTATHSTVITLNNFYPQK